MAATLRKYGKVRLDFLTEILGRYPEEVEEAAATLEGEGVLRRDGDEVALESIKSKGR